MQPTLIIALRAARAVAEKLKFNAEQRTVLMQEGMNADAILERGLSDAEYLAVKTIRKAHPDQNIEILQSGMQEARTPMEGVLWRINLLSGLNNYQRSLPNVALSVMQLVKGKVEHVVVMNPFTEDTFTASRGRGMQCNEKRSRSSTVQKPEQATVGIHGFELQDDKLVALQKVGADVLLTGCPLLDLAQAAAGRLDAAMVQNVEEMDLQAAQLLAQESGALTGELTGRPISSKTDNLLIANQKLFKALVQIKA